MCLSQSLCRLIICTIRTIGMLPGRTKRPLPDSIQFARGKFERIWAGDGSTLEAIFRKLNSLEDVPIGKLAGKMGVVIDLITRLPVAIW